MPITASRLKSGTLTLGADPLLGEFSCQYTAVKITPSYEDDGDAQETLCGESIPAGKKETWTLNGTSLQDFDDPAGLLAYCYDNAMTEVAFTWSPNTVGAPTWAGNVQIVALEEGGDVNSRLTTDFEWEIVGRPTRTPGVPPPPAPPARATAGASA